MRTHLLLLAVASSSACAAKPARPATITSATPPQATLEVVVRELSAHGLTVAHIDEQAGVVQTEWQATDFKYGFGPNDRDAYIVRRFTVTIAPARSGAGSDVSVSVDDMKCEDPGLFFSDGAVHGGCVDVDGVVPPDQEEVERIAARLAAALGAAPEARSQ